ncbi:glucosaminidase domain-containing protein [Chloroflexus sp.]
MSAFSRRNRNRRLGQPLFSIEETESVQRLPRQPLAELTSDLDALLEQHVQPSRPEEPIGLRVPEDVRSAYRRAQRSRTDAYHRPQTHQETAKHARPATPERSVTDHTALSAPPRGNTAPPIPSARHTVGAYARSNGSSSTAQLVAGPERTLVTLARDAVAVGVDRRLRNNRLADSTSVGFTPLPEATDLPLPVGQRSTPWLWAARANQWPVMVGIGLVSLVIIVVWLATLSRSPILSFQYAVDISRAVQVNAASLTNIPALGDHRLRSAPSLTPAQIDEILRSYGSPATGTGEIWYRLGLEYNIDPAYAIAFFIHESGAGTNPNWAGMKPDGSTTHNVGNIICAGYPTCYGRFRDYPDWETGIADWYRLIDVEYIRWRGLQTVADIIPIYAPSFENDVQGYIQVVTGLVDRWRSGQIP